MTICTMAKAQTSAFMCHTFQAEPLCSPRQAPSPLTSQRGIATEWSSSPCLYQILTAYSHHDYCLGPSPQDLAHDIMVLRH